MNFDWSSSHSLSRLSTWPHQKLIVERRPLFTSMCSNFKFTVDSKMLLTLRPFVTPIPNWEDHKLSQSLAGLACMRDTPSGRQACVYPVKAPKNWSQNWSQCFDFSIFSPWHSTPHTREGSAKAGTHLMIHARSFLRKSLVAVLPKTRASAVVVEWLENRATGRCFWDYNLMHRPRKAYHTSWTGIFDF